jgi:head-tail adaptor
MSCCSPKKKRESLLPTNEMRDRIRFEKLITTQDIDYGTPVDVWVQVGAISRAWVQDVLPSRAELGDRSLRIEYRPARIRYRYRTDIDSAMRVILLNRQNRIMKIVSGPAELDNRDGMEIMAEAYSTSGIAS